jgi:hypothetical protein
LQAINSLYNLYSGKREGVLPSLFFCAYSVTGIAAIANGENTLLEIFARHFDDLRLFGGNLRNRTSEDYQHVERISR